MLPRDTYRCDDADTLRRMASNPADRIEELLKARGWSKRELAQRAGMHPSQGGNIVARLRAKPDAIEKATMEKLAEALGVPVQEIFFVDDAATQALGTSSVVPRSGSMLSRALWQASRVLSGIEPEDYDAARAVDIESQQFLGDDPVRVDAFAENILRAAASLRREGKAATVVAILGRVAAGATFGAEARNEGEHPAVTAALESAAADAGMVRGERRDVVVAARARVAARKS